MIQKNKVKIRDNSIAKKSKVSSKRSKKKRRRIKPKQDIYHNMISLNLNSDLNLNGSQEIEHSAKIKSSNLLRNEDKRVKKKRKVGSNQLIPSIRKSGEISLDTVLGLSSILKDMESPRGGSPKKHHQYNEHGLIAIESDESQKSEKKKLSKSHKKAKVRKGSKRKGSMQIGGKHNRIYTAFNLEDIVSRLDEVIEEGNFDSLILCKLCRLFTHNQ